jgi:hypothetical protein
MIEVPRPVVKSKESTKFVERVAKHVQEGLWKAKVIA